MSEQFGTWDPSEDQSRALEAILRWYRDPHQRETKPLLTVGGLAGCGKTAMAGRLARVLSEGDGINIAFATFTGKASLVLEKSLKKSGFNFAGHSISTIHRLLYLPQEDPLTGRIIGWTKAREIPFDLILIDEASMVPSEVVRDLLSYGVPILAIGDHGQLPPVGEDSGLMKNPDYRLETVHRQAKGNPIIELASLVRQGFSLDVLVDFIRDHKDDERLQHRTGQGGIQEALDFAAPPGMLITFTNYLRTNVNTKARRWYRRKGPPQVDEVVLCVKNAYLDAGLLANGTRGVIKSIADYDDHRFKVTLDVDDVEPLEVLTSKYQFGQPHTFKGFDEVPGKHYSWESVGALIDYGYTLTCHKSQGSQAPNVAVVMERSLWRLSSEEWTRWTYTAFTRSSENLMVITGV